MEEFVSETSTPRYVETTISSKPGEVRNMGIIKSAIGQDHEEAQKNCSLCFLFPRFVVFSFFSHNRLHCVVQQRREYALFLNLTSSSQHQPCYI